MILDNADSFMRTLNSLPTATPTHVGKLPSPVPDAPEFQAASEAGTTVLWVVFVIMSLASALFTGWSFSVPVSKRLYHVVTTLIVVFASLSYFAMATGHGVSYHEIKVRDQNDHVPDTETVIYRQVYWARYVDWSVTTPLLLLDLGLLAGLNGAHLLMAIVADVIMILTGLFAAFGTEGTPQKWGWYTIACFAYVVVIWHLVVNGRAQAAAKSQSISSFYVSIAGFTLLIWTAYPIVWGIADGSRMVSVDGEIVAYAILDVLAKPIFGLWLLVTHTKMPETNIDIGGFWTHGMSREGALRLRDDDGA